MDKAAQKIINSYAHDLEGLTLTECMDTGFSAHQCGVLSGALGYGLDAVITPDEYKKMEVAGFSREFIDGIGGYIRSSRFRQTKKRRPQC